MNMLADYPASVPALEAARIDPSVECPDERVLVLAPVGRDAQVACDALRQHHFQGIACAGMEALCHEISCGAGVVLITDDALSCMSCDRLVKSLTDQPRWSDLPVLLLTRASSGTGSGQIRELMRVGCVQLLERPLRKDSFLSAVRAALRSRRRQYEIRDYLGALHAHEEALNKGQQALTARVSELEALYRIGSAVAKVDQLSDLYDTAIDVLIGLGADRAAVLLFDPDGIMRFKAHRGLSQGYREAVEGHSPWRPETCDPQPVLVPDAATDPGVAAFRETISREGIAALAFIPLVGEGRLLGKFMVYCNSPHCFTDYEVRLISAVANHVAHGVLRKRAQQELSRHRDHLEELVASRTDALLKSLDQLRRAERLASIGTLAAGVAHEINNPLNSILMAAQFAARYPGKADFKQTLETISSEAERGGRIVRGILKFAKDEKTVKAPADLNETVRHAADLVRIYLPSAPITLKLDLNPLPPVPLNGTEMEQVFVNLVKNAWQAANGPVDVVAQTRLNRDWVELLVRDNGPGIAESHLRHIFDPFFSTRRDNGGTGLGLSICHGIVSDHGGTIAVHSTVGKGTEFTIRLPAGREVANG